MLDAMLVIVANPAEKKSRKAIMLPSSPKVIANLVDKGWIERGGTDAEIAYRITEKGLAAKKAPVPIC
jgi:hypothetical protein